MTSPPTAIPSPSSWLDSLVQIVGLSDRRRHFDRIRRLQHGQLPDGGRHCRLRPLPRHEKLHLALALVPRRDQQPLVVVVGQHWPKQTHRCQGQRPMGKLRQNRREASRRTRRLDPAVGCVLRQVQDAGAVGEERRAAGTEIQTPEIEFRQGRDQRGCGLPFSRS